MSFPVCLKAVFTDGISLEWKPSPSHWFQFNPWLTFKTQSPFNLIQKHGPFQPYLSFIHFICSHPSRSDLLSIWFKKTCLSVLPFTPGPTAFIQNTLSALTIHVSTEQTLAVPQDPLYCHFLPEASLSYPTNYPLCLFTTSVPLSPSCSILQLLDLIVLRDS